MKTSFLYHLLMVFGLLATINGFGSPSPKAAGMQQGVRGSQEQQKLDKDCLCVKDSASIGFRSNYNYQSLNRIPDWSKKDTSLTLLADWFQLMQFGLDDLGQLYIRNIVFSLPLYLVNCVLLI